MSPIGTSSCRTCSPRTAHPQVSYFWLSLTHRFNNMHSKFHMTCLNIRYTRQGDHKDAAAWLQLLQPYVDAWATASQLTWHSDGPFDEDEFDGYLQSYRRSTRLYLVQPAVPDELPEPTLSDAYPIVAHAGIRQHTVCVK
jgi:hypothetical protein